MDILARRGVAFKVLRDALSPWVTRRANAAGVRGPGWKRGAGGRAATHILRARRAQDPMAEQSPTENQQNECTVVREPSPARFAPFGIF
jgi:hypothetical protein